MTRPLAAAVLRQAQRHCYAVPAFNVSTLEQVRVIVETARWLRAPVIIATSEGESNLMTYHEAVAVVEAWRQHLRWPIIINSDHHHSFARVKQAVDAGYTLVHIDASRLPYRRNAMLTKQVVAYAHRRGVFVEGELGAIGGGSSRHRGRARVTATELTSPTEAVAFVRATGIDILAANIGNIHGLWSGGKPHVAIARLMAIHRLTKVFLTLHGGSGIPARDIRRAIRHGITKINVNTELRVAFISALRRTLREHRSETTPYELYPAAMAAMGRVVEGKIRLFGAAGRV
jgi:ketose-bisphosphate aldolase